MLFQSSIKVLKFSVMYFVCGHAHVAGEGQSVFSFLEIRLSGLGSTEKCTQHSTQAGEHSTSRKRKPRRPGLFSACSPAELSCQSSIYDL